MQSTSSNQNLAASVKMENAVIKGLEQQGSGNKEDCNLVFLKGHQHGRKKTHPEK
jgi:hypothetical protein